MRDEQLDREFEALMRDAARTYNRPPALPDPDAMWRTIERALPAAAGERPALAVLRGGGDAPRPAARRATLLTNPWLRTAAVLLVGVAIGRASVRGAAPAGARGVMATVAAAAAAPTQADAPAPGRAATSEYLGMTAALLAALPDELRARRADPAYLSRADALLLRTRLLLDSPAAADPALRSLFDDLEIVLAQVVRLSADRDSTRIDFLNEALEQRDVLPRLRDAVAENAGD
jgi:hypothetical protein